MAEEGQSHQEGGAATATLDRPEARSLGLGVATEQPQTQEQTDKPTLKDIIDKAKDIGAENRERHILRNKAKEAWNKTRDVARNTSDVVRGLASKDVRGELKMFAKDKLDSAKESLVDRYDNIMDKTAQKKDATVAKAGEKIRGVRDRAKERFITNPSERVKKFGKRTETYFVNKGKNFADGIRARQSEADAKYYQSKADLFARKNERMDRKLSRNLSNIDSVKDSGRERKVNRLQRRSERISSRSESVRSVANSHKELARASRENAAKFRTNIAGRK